MKKLLLSCVAIVLGAHSFTSNATDYYLIGQFNDWTSKASNCKFTEITEGISYVLYYEGTLTNDFKINDGTWTNDNANFGANIDNLPLSEGTVYWLNNKGENIQLNNGNNIVNPYLLFNPEAGSLIITTQENSHIYGLHGNWTSSDWSTTLLTENNGNWELDAQDFPTGDFGVKQMDRLTQEQTAWISAASSETTVKANEEMLCKVNGSNFKNAAGNYKVIFDPAEMTIQFEGTQTGELPPTNYSNWYVNIKGGFNDWADNGEQPNVENITTHNNLPIGNTEFKIYVWAESEGYWYSTGGSIETGKWITIDGNENNNMTIAGATIGQEFDVLYNVETNAIFVTPVSEATYPENMYMVGNFNGWDLKNQIAMTPAQTPGVYTYSGSFEELGGELNFKFTNGTNDWNSSDMIQYGGSNFSLYSEQTYEGEITVGGENLYCNNWQGGEINITLDIPNMTVTISAPDQLKEGAAPKALYLVGNMTEWSLTNRDYKLELQNDGTYSGTFDLNETYTYTFESDGQQVSETQAPKFKVFYEANWNTVYGAQGESAIEVDFTQASTLSTAMVVGDGAQDWLFTNWGGGEVTVTVNWTVKSLTLTYLDADVENETVVNVVINEQLYPLNLQIGEENAYYGTIETKVLNGASMAIVVSVGEEETEYGPANAVTINDETTALNGNLVEVSNNNVWILNWAGGTIGVSVNINDMTYSFDIKSSGVSSFETVDGEAVYYNLQGVRVNNPQNGIYIIKRGNKTSKVIVR